MSHNATLLRIGRTDPGLENKIRRQHGYVLEDDVDRLIAVERLMLVMVRCGNGRFMCPIQDLKHFMTIIEEHSELKATATGKKFAGDHVRDVSIPA